MNVKRSLIISLSLVIVKQQKIIYCKPCNAYKYTNGYKEFLSFQNCTSTIGIHLRLLSLVNTLLLIKFYMREKTLSNTLLETILEIETIFKGLTLYTYIL